MSFKFGTTILTLAVVVLLLQIQALKLRFARRECITENVNGYNDKIKLSFVSLPGQFTERGIYDITVYDPQQQKVVEKRAVSSAELEYAAKQQGQYTFCFSEIVRKRGAKTDYEVKEVMIEIIMGGQNTIDHVEDKAKEEHLQEVWQSIGILRRYLQELRWQSRYQQELDVAHIEAAGAVRRCIDYMVSLKVIVLVCVGFFQVFAVTHFFNFNRNRGLLG
eukprot:TRINITY_DN2129_c0_g1_i2.p2 TRINITY_DN2129_c0_g1~~TRINITY_DN2129_c0_g1_i2.p2  ORF type:complete len:220 (-),score=17.58 TRINITY_DN2129_c0_g1_i2:365-1024(-)